MVVFTNRPTLESRVFILNDVCVNETVVAQIRQLFIGGPVQTLDGRVLAKELKKLIDFRNVICVGRGGAVAYALLRQAGAGVSCAGEIDIERKYTNGKPEVYITRLPQGDLSYCVLLDDVIASGQTISAAAQQMRLEEAATLLFSTQPRGQYRTRDGSTVSGLDTISYARGVNCSSGFPAIFSLRFLRKAIGITDYDTYLQKYVGGNLPTLKAILRPNTEKPPRLDALFGAGQQNA